MRRIVPVLAATVLVLTSFLFSYVPADACHGGCYTPCHGCYLEGNKGAGASTENGRMPGAAADAFMLQDATPTPEDICNEGLIDPENFPNTTRELRGFAHREQEAQGENRFPDVPLCEIEIFLNETFAEPPNPALSTSLVSPGEATVFVVHQGRIEFINENAEGGSGYLRVVPMDGDDFDELTLIDGEENTYLAELGDTFTLSAGASIYLDNQPGIVALRYTIVEPGPEPLTGEPEVCKADHEAEGCLFAAQLHIVAAPLLGGPEGTPEP